MNILIFVFLCLIIACDSWGWTNQRELPTLKLAKKSNLINAQCPQWNRCNFGPKLGPTTQETTTTAKLHAPGEKSINGMTRAKNLMLNPSKKPAIIITKLAKMARTDSLHYTISPSNLEDTFRILSKGITSNSPCGLKLQKFLNGRVGDDFKAGISFNNEYKNFTKNGVEITLTNRIFIKRKGKLDKNFKKGCKSYNTKVTRLDFSNQNKVRSRINKIISTDTNKLIPNFLPADQPHMNTEIMLVNYVYFEGSWKIPFDTRDTLVDSFTKEDGTKVDIKFMSKEIKFMAKKKNSFNASVFVLNYSHPDFVFVIVKPYEHIKLIDVEDDLFANLESIDKSIEETKETTAKIWLPKINTTFEFDLERGLRSEGLSCLFESGVDKMISQGTLSIGSIMQKIKFEANEEGTRGAATTVSGGYNRIAVETYVMDVPFLHMVYNKKHKKIIFWGRFADPSPVL